MGYIDNVINLTSKNKFVGKRWIHLLIETGIADCDDDRIALSVVGLARMNAYHSEALGLMDD